MWVFTVSVLLPIEKARSNPHWTQARKLARKSFDVVACVQCEHSHSRQLVPFACVVPGYPMWIGLISSLRKSTQQEALVGNGPSAKDPDLRFGTFLSLP